MSGEQPFDPTRLEAAQREGEAALDRELDASEPSTDLEKIDRLTDLEQIRAMGLAFHSQSGSIYRAIAEQYPDLRPRATELWTEVETALADLEQSKSLNESRRCLREIIYNQAKLGILLMRPQDEAAEG